MELQIHILHNSTVSPRRGNRKKAESAKKNRARARAKKNRSLRDRSFPRAHARGIACARRAPRAQALKKYRSLRDRCARSSKAGDLNLHPPRFPGRGVAWIKGYKPCGSIRIRILLILLVILLSVQYGTRYTTCECTILDTPPHE